MSREETPPCPMGHWLVFQGCLLQCKHHSCGREEKLTTEDWTLWKYKKPNLEVMVSQCIRGNEGEVCKEMEEVV